jgi:tetratricopeptide (TPR) repeat protein
MKIFGLDFGVSLEKKLLNELGEYYRYAEEHPNDIRVHLRIAEVLMKMEKIQKAIEEYIYAAEAYEANNLSQIAAAIYKQILQIDPDQVNVYQTLVNTHLNEGFLGDAIATYEELASYYYNRGMKDEAIDTMEKMVRLDPDSVYVRKKITSFYAKRKIKPQTVKARASGRNWELSDTATGGNESTKQFLQQKEEGFFDLESALQEEISIEAMPQNLEGLRESGDGTIPGFDEIFKEMQQAESEMTENNGSLFHYNLGTAFQKTGRLDEAIDELNKSLEDPKRSADCYLRMAICSRGKNLTNDAIKYLKKGLGSKILSELKRLELQYELAMAYKTRGKMGKAKKLLKQIQKINDSFREVEKELSEVT